MKLYRADRWTGTWKCPGRTRAQGPLTLEFEDGVVEIDEATLADLEPWLERNQFSVDDNRGGPPAPSVPEGDDYESWTMAELKAALKDAGLPVSGSKAELVDRLAGV